MNDAPLLPGADSRRTITADPHPRPRKPRSQPRPAAASHGLESLEPRLLLSAGLTGEYFDNINLTDPADTRIDATVNFPTDWGDAPPGTAVAADDNYSVRWTGFVNVETAGLWTFTTTSNDGVRLWIDGTQIIDNWDQHAVQTDNGSIPLDAGWHDLRLEYFQQNGTAEITLSYAGPGQAKAIIPSTRLGTVDPDGTDPDAEAGPSKLVVLPSDSVTLTGSATDADGTVESYQWTQVSGPNDATLSGADTATLGASGLVEGSYVFELTVTDNDGNTDADTATVTVAPESSGTAVLTGERKTWHKLTFTWDGPRASETDANNPFRNYRLDVTFTGPSGQTYVVPGYFAADGDAGNTHADSGNRWRAHFSPDEAGTWSYVVSFLAGQDVAVADVEDLGGFSAAGFFHGDSGTFDVDPTDKSGRDLRGKGRLDYVGERYLRFRETGEYFLKQGPDSPENLLAYEDFDGSFKSDGVADNRVKRYPLHIPDWNVGDPAWDSENDADGDPDNGKGLVGAINYLASEGLNSISFLPMNIGGDDKNVFPYRAYNNSASNGDVVDDRTRFDVSKLDQWEVVFKHANDHGFFLHFKTQETENDQLLDGGDLGAERRLYYRELIARFSHHQALNWNLGEEITNTTAQVRSFAQYFHDTDPYNHHVVAHTFPGQKDQRYDPLLGDQSRLTGASLQTSNADFRNVFGDTRKWVNDSAAAGKPWAIAVDEPGDAQHALRPDNDAGNSHEDGRKNALWGTLMAGGWGNEWYFGYGHAHSDLTLEDFRSRDDWWDYTRYALDFFDDLPVNEMVNDNAVSSAANDYGFYQAGETYAVYLKDGGTTNLDLTGAEGEFTVRWYDPRNGGMMQIGSVESVAGGGVVNLGTPPNAADQDWAILVEAVDPDADKLLFIRGGDRTGGFLENPTDFTRTEQLADINNFAQGTINGRANHGWGTLRLVLEGEGYVVEQVTEGSETSSGPAQGIHVDFETMDLTQYAAIVLGSNNAVYDTAAIDAIEQYVRGGGAVLFISDANFGGNWADAPDSDQQFLDRFGLAVNQDQGTYAITRGAGDFDVPDHPIFEGVNGFDGEGVSPGVLDAPTAGVTATILANAEGNTRENPDPPGDAVQGSSRPVNADDAALLIAEADAGRLAIHYDRNTFFNQGGAGTDITRFDNRQYAINLFDWLTTTPEPTPIAGDLDGDGDVDVVDLDLFADSLLSNGEDLSGDLDGDNDVDVVDLDLFADALLGQAPVTPAASLTAAPSEGPAAAEAPAVEPLAAAEPLPSGFRVDVSATADAAARSAVIGFGYADAQNFAFAGVLPDAEGLVIGEVGDGVRRDLVVVDASLEPGTTYGLSLTIEGGRATLSVDGGDPVTYGFGRPLNSGGLGLGGFGVAPVFEDLVISPLAGLV